MKRPNPKKEKEEKKDVKEEEIKDQKLNFSNSIKSSNIKL